MIRQNDFAAAAANSLEESLHNQLLEARHLGLLGDQVPSFGPLPDAGESRPARMARGLWVTAGAGLAGMATSRGAVMGALLSI